MDASRAKSDAERFELCFERNYGDVARYCARRLPKHEDAEDAATEVFATAWRRRRELPGEPRDRLWLFGIARRVVANTMRAHQRRSRLRARLTDQPSAPVAPPASAGLEAARLARALSALSPSDRELLLLTGWEGLRPAEIARVLGRPAALVSRRLHRARRRLAAELAAAGNHETAYSRSMNPMEAE